MKKFRERKKDDTKTRKTLRKAAYQYCLDHTYNTPKGLLVNFYLPEEDEFYRKLEVREYLDYVRVQKDEQYEDFHKWLRQYKKLERAFQWQKMMDRKNIHLYKNGSLYIKIIIKIKRWCTKRINKELEKIRL